MDRQAKDGMGKRFTPLDRSLCDLAMGRLEGAPRRIMEDLVATHPDLQAKLARIQRLYAEDSAETEPQAAAPSLFWTAWDNAAQALRQHAARVWQWRAAPSAAGLPLAALCSAASTDTTLPYTYWDALAARQSTLPLPEAAPADSLFLAGDTIVFSWRPVFPEGEEEDQLIVRSSSGTILRRVRARPGALGGETRWVAALAAASLLDPDASGPDDPPAELTWQGGMHEARFGILRHPPPEDAAPCSDAECAAMADACLAWCWPGPVTDDDIACLARGLEKLRGEPERALLRAFLTLRDYVWRTVPDRVIAGQPALTYLAAAATLRAGAFMPAPLYTGDPA